MQQKLKTGGKQVVFQIHCLTNALLETPLTSVICWQFLLIALQCTFVFFLIL